MQLSQITNKWSQLQSNTKRNVIIVVAVLLALFVSFTAGRYSAPAKVVEKEKIVEKKVEVVSQTAINEAVASAKAQWAKEVKDHTIIKYEYKEGKVVEKIVYVDRDTSSSGSVASTNTTSSVAVNTSTTVETKVTEKEKTTTYKTDRYHLSISGSIPWDQAPTGAGSVVWEGRGEIRIAGGLWGGLTVTPKEKLFGAVLSLQF